MSFYFGFGLLAALFVSIFALVVYQLGWLGVGCFAMAGIATGTLYVAVNLITGVWR